jgi:FKBP-type peptidyl-prolyl cis-trans isomerase
MNTKTIFALTLVIIFLGVAVFVFYKKSNSVGDGSKTGLNPTASVTPLPTPTPTPENNKIIQMENGLKIEDLKIGTGTEAKAGDTISVNYVGSLENGTVFDASEKHGGPATFQIGVGQLIKGWDIGIPGMKVGGKRKLVVPPSLGYGSQNVGNGLIPPNSTLTFEVELVSVQAPKQ